VLAVSDGAPTTASVADILGRDVTNAQAGFDATAVLTTTEYNAKGEVYRVSRPYYSGATVYWNSFGYDALGRITSETNPGETGNLTTYLAYASGSAGQYMSQMSTTDVAGRIRREQFNLRGELVKAIDAAGTFDPITPTLSTEADTAYTYDQFGNLVTVRVENNAATDVINTQVAKTPMMSLSFRSAAVTICAARVGSLRRVWTAR
jgi:YD repeat-containing protein